jgi:protein TonB
VVRQTVEKVNPEREVASSTSVSHSVQPLPVNKAPEASAPAGKPANIPTINGIDYESEPMPVYPALSRRLRETGRTTLRVLVGVDGRPERIELHSSSGSEALDRAAFEATARAIFRPYRASGKAVQAWTVVPIRFSLD